MIEKFVAISAAILINILYYISMLYVLQRETVL